MQKQSFGGCCVAMHGSAAADAETAFKMGRIMLKYRPIAPKPTAPGSLTDAKTTTLCPSKRKGASARGRGRKSKKQTAVSVLNEPISPSSSSSSILSTTTSGSASKEQLITLPLMPETPERKENRQPMPQPSTISFPLFSTNQLAPKSLVTVESITDLWELGAGGAGDVAVILKALTGDESPAFVSDAWDRVTWTNEAYKRMTAEGCGDREVPVGLVTRGMVPVSCRAFTCRVHVRHEGRKVSLAAPCDVWWLGSGRWAWRVDVKAALSL